jgi:hypothetical protein
VRSRSRAGLLFTYLAGVHRLRSRTGDDAWCPFFVYLYPDRLAVLQGGGKRRSPMNNECKVETFGATHAKGTLERLVEVVYRRLADVVSACLVHVARRPSVWRARGGARARAGVVLCSRALRSRQFYSYTGFYTKEMEKRTLDGIEVLELYHHDDVDCVQVGVVTVFVSSWDRRRSSVVQLEVRGDIYICTRSRARSGKVASIVIGRVEIQTARTVFRL